MTASDRAGGIDLRGRVSAGVALVSAVATCAVTAGSGFGPAALAAITWFVLIWTAAWAAFVTDRARAVHRFAAVLVASVVSYGLVLSIQEVWGVVFPLAALLASLARLRSPSRVLALASWLAVAGYVVLTQ